MRFQSSAVGIEIISGIIRPELRLEIQHLGAIPPDRACCTGCGRKGLRTGCCDSFHLLFWASDRLFKNPHSSFPDVATGTHEGQRE